MLPFVISLLQKKVMLKGGRTNVKFINKVILGLYFALMRNLPFKVLIPLGPGIIHVHPLFFFKLQALAACFTYWFPPLLLSPVFLSGYLASLCFCFFIYKGIGLAWLVKNIFKIYNPLEKISLNLDCFLVEVRWKSSIWLHRVRCENQWTWICASQSQEKWRWPGVTWGQ